MKQSPQTLQELLTDGVWLRRLAGALVSDPADADDVAQFTAIAGIEHPPRATGDPRHWLATVARNFARMMGRTTARRARREAVLLEAAEAVPSPEALVERAELQRQLATLLTDLEEPYRTTVLLCYFEDLSPSEIAQRLAVPAGTVRWRLKRGLDQLRTRLDRLHSNRRAAWLLPMTALRRTTNARAPLLLLHGSVLMAKKLMIAAAALLLLLLLLIAQRHRHQSVGVSASATPHEPVSAARSSAVSGNPASDSASITHRLSGVVMARDKPYAGASVLLSDLSGPSPTPARRARSGADGRFDFGLLPSRRYSVTATASGHRPANAIADLTKAKSEATNIELRLGDCEASVFGFVRDSGGGPLVGAHVRALASSASSKVPVEADQLGGPVAETDSAGRYEVCVAEGQNGIAVEAAAYGGEVFWTNVSRRVRHDVTLAPEANVVGRVVRLADESAVPFARVEARSVTPGVRQGLPAVGIADEKGHFRLTGMSPGRWRVFADADGMALSQPADVMIEPTRTTGEIVCRMEPAVRLSGVVLNGDEPLPNTAILATSTYQNRKTPAAVTTDDGRFTLERVPRGQLVLDVAGYEVRDPRVIRVGGPPVEVTVHVAPLGSLVGLVVRNGAPASYSHVVAQGPHGNSTAEADAQGRFRIGALRSGKYALSAWNGTLRASSPALKLTLANAEHRAGLTLQLSQSASVSGIVVDDRKRPVPNALVRLSADDGTTALGNTDDAGRFLVDELAAPRHYSARVFDAESATELLPARDFPSIDLAQPDQALSGVELVVHLNRSTIAGHVVDIQGSPVADVRVSASPMGAYGDVYIGNWRAYPTATTGSDGSFEITNLADGTYGLHAYGGDGSEGVAKDVKAGERNVTIVVQAAGGIDGTLVGFSQPPDVLVQRSGVMYMVPLRAIVSGDRFSIRGLSPAAYEVRTGGVDEGDDVVVQVQAGQIAEATLRSRGSASLSGRVFDFQTKAPLAGMGCVSWFQNGLFRIVRPLPGVAWTDENGHFDIANMPAGAVGVTCWNDQSDYSDGIVALTVEQGKHVNVEVPVVHGTNGPHTDYGIDLDNNYRVPIVGAVTPGSTADRAGVRRGDLIVTVDGVDVTPLSFSGVDRLIQAHNPGDPLTIGVARGGGTTILKVAGRSP